MTHPFFTGTATPRIFAHRGLVLPEAAAHGVVENSFAAVATAHAEGVEYVESDCHLTADGVVVLFHDSDLARVAGDPRAVADVSSHELEEIMSQRGGLITLRQALESFPDLRFNLDVKAAAAAEQVGQLVAPHSNRVLITSFSDERRMLALASAARAGGTPATSAGTRTVATLLAASSLGVQRLAHRRVEKVDALQIPERKGMLRILTPRLIRAAHQFEIEVHVWTVNDVETMLRLLRMGIDGIVTDRADLALAVLR
ncbi:glycerophosphoryl diester phosphodiesterase [Microbacterium halimionae]|uniref:Glycerophosphoryl diester phosphodiesterase n=1 Tax=Microbacterium halimionae TaxID=1526413 RepID=A0A7W3JNT6_9MICO|nr:glycerophosphodiester phosphodiesterase family protein [Microbacterium halimionae]MBA8816184.1 glycerophosphoryl diester phosphodiesterase [Microbacterium halimionae]NII96386.1 glycerophosphoryl diester phosphodiesterase [Microbacterium halimionae]